MKKLFFIIFLMVFSFAITANAKKPKVVWPKAVLTLKDGTVLNGYLRIDVHFMTVKDYVLFSETEEGKDVKYKNETIKSLSVENAFGNGKNATFIPIHLYWREANKILKSPTLVVENFKGKHVTGYLRPTVFDNSTTSRSFTGIITNSTSYLTFWDYYYMVDSDSTHNRSYWYIFGNKKINDRRNNKSQKKMLKRLRKDFEKYPAVADEVEKRGLTSEQIHEDPTILLEILDKSLQ